MRVLLAAAVLTACSCAGAPIAPDAQRQIDAISAQYARAWVRERDCEDRLCKPPQALADMQRANYVAAAAIVTANNERTASALAAARDKTRAFDVATW